MLQTFLKSLSLAVSGLHLPLTSCWVAPGLARVAACLGTNLGLFWAPSHQTQVAAICSLCREAQGRAQAVADFAPPRRPHSQHTLGTASDKARLQPHHPHERHTQGAHSVSTKAPLKQVLLRSINACKQLVTVGVVGPCS